MQINDFCDIFLFECLNKIAPFYNTCILMGDFNVDLRKSHTDNVTSKLEVMTSCFFCSLYSATYACCWLICNANRQYFHGLC